MSFGETKTLMRTNEKSKSVDRLYTFTRLRVFHYVCFCHRLKFLRIWLHFLKVGAAGAEKKDHFFLRIFDG